MEVLSQSKALSWFSGETFEFGFSDGHVRNGDRCDVAQSLNFHQNGLSVRQTNYYKINFEIFKTINLIKYLLDPLAKCWQRIATNSIQLFLHFLLDVRIVEQVK